MRLDSGATDSHMRRQGSSVQEKDCCARASPPCPLSSRRTAASHPPSPSDASIYSPLLLFQWRENRWWSN